MSDPFAALLAKQAPVSETPEEDSDPFNSLLKKGKPAAAPAAPTTKAGEIPTGSPYAAPPKAEQDSSTLGKLVRGKGVLETGADLLDLGLVGVPAAVVGAVGDVTNRASALARGKSWREAGRAGNAFFNHQMEVAGRPVYDSLKRAGLIDPQTNSIPQQAMGKVGDWLTRQAEISEQTTGLPKEDYLSSVNGFMALMGVKGAKFAVKDGVRVPLTNIGIRGLDERVAAGNRSAWDTALERFDAEEQLARAKFEEVTPERTAAKAAAEQPAGDPLYGGNFAAEAAARRKAYEQRKAYEKGLRDFPPSGERTGSRDAVDLSLEGKETPTTYGGNQPFHTADTTAALKRGVVADTPIQTEGRLAPVAATPLDSGLLKVKENRLFDMTMEERLAVKNSTKITDPKVITAAAVGATGLGLAMAYEPSAEEAAMAIGAGALLRRGGVGETMRELAARPDATPLGAMLESSAYTTSTLEKLADASPGKFEFKKTAVEQLLKREGVTKHERDLMTAALAQASGETITAKQLMVGLRVAAQDFELTPLTLDKSKFQWADYGLENIDRDFLTPELASELGSAAEAGGVPVVRFYELPKGLDIKPLEKAIERVPGGHIYRPGTFGHTRSFTEDGIRHIFELQNNQAQYAEKAVKAGKMAPEEEASLVAARESADAIRSLWSSTQYGASRTGDWSPWKALENFEKKAKALNEMQSTQARESLDRHLFMESSTLPEIKRLADRYADEWQTGRDSETLDTYARGWIDISGGFSQWLRANEGSVRPEAVRQLRDAIFEFAEREVGQAKARLGEIEASLSSVDARPAYDRISPMLKDWHKRLVREEIADAERARGQTQNLIAEKRRAIAAYEAELRQTSGGIPQEWVGDQSLAFRQGSRILERLAGMLERGETTSVGVADKMQRVEASLSPEGQAKWKEYYETYADETGDFLANPKDWEGSGNYVAEFPRVMARFFEQAVGKQDSRAAKDYLDGLREDIARLEAQAKPAVRFATADTVAKVEGWPEGNFGDGTQQFRPEHQGIYDRYSRDVEKFLRQLGAQPITDSAGHTWLEVPLGEQQKALPGGGARTQIGGVDPALMKSVAAIGGTAALAAWLSNDKDKVKHAAMAGVLTGLGLLAKSRFPAIGTMVKQTTAGIQQLVGNLSTDSAVTAPLLRRLTEHARAELKGIHDAGRVVAPFLEIASQLPASVQRELNVALMNGSTTGILAAVGKAATPGLLKEWNKVQAQLKAFGAELQSVGLLKELRPDYFPRIVKDLPGLLNAIGKEYAVPLQRALDEATKRAGHPLDEADRAAIINRFIEKNLRGQPGQGKASFFKRRTIDNVSVDLEPFYVEPLQALPLYIGSVVRAVEKARFFGRDAVKDPTTGKLDLTASIGNVVAREIDAGNLTPENFTRLTEILRTRFGTAYSAPARPLQTLGQLTNIALLGNVFSGMMNLADIGTIAAQHGVVPLAAAVAAKLGKRQKISAADVGMANQIMEEFVYGTREPVKVKVPFTERTVQLSMAKALDATFKYSGFKAFDQVMKEVALNAAFEKYSRLSRTKAGEARIKRQYDSYFTSDMPQLLADLRAGAKSKLTVELAFRELSDAQPVTKIEMPQFYLDHPNLRFGFALKSFMIKQINLIRRRGVDEIRRGNFKEGAGFLMRYALFAGAAGATMDWVVKSLLGRDADLEWKNIPLNALKNFGLSEYVIDKARQGKGKEAILAATVPPVDPILNIVTADPEAVRYIPLVGRLAYDRLMDGAEKANAAKKLAEKKRKREEERTPSERRELERRALERRQRLLQEN